LAISISLLLRLASATLGGFLSTIELTPGLLILGVIYFVLGYLLFGVVSLAIAAICSTVREAQGIAPLFTLAAVAPFWFISLLMFFPNSPIWVVLSFVPFERCERGRAVESQTGAPSPSVMGEGWDGGEVRIEASARACAKSCEPCGRDRAQDAGGASPAIDRSHSIAVENRPRHS